MLDKSPTIAPSYNAYVLSLKYKNEYIFDHINYCSIWMYLSISDIFITSFTLFA